MSGPSENPRRISSPASRWSRRASAAIACAGSSTNGCTTSRRAYVSSCWVMVEPRDAASMTASRSSRRGSCGASCSSTRCACPSTTVSRLLKSCATPPASRPTDSTRSACRRCVVQGALRELRALLVGHVLGQPQEVRDRAGLVEDRGNHGAFPVDRAILAALLELAAPLLAGQQRRPDLEAESRIGVPRPQHGVGLPPHHVAREARHLLEATVDVLDAPVGIGQADERGQLLEASREHPQIANLVGELEVAMFERRDQRLVVQTPRLRLAGLEVG